MKIRQTEKNSKKCQEIKTEISVSSHADMKPTKNIQISSVS